jgi:hypothetical protein
MPDMNMPRVRPPVTCLACLPLALAAFCFAPAVLGQLAISPTNGFERIEIRGSLGTMTSMEMNADGSFAWAGLDPVKKTTGVFRGTIGPGFLRRIREQAREVTKLGSSAAYVGGPGTYTLVVRTGPGVQSEFRITTGKEDRRPKEIRLLMEMLWATRSRAR